jgi:hypothetical protein
MASMRPTSTGRGRRVIAGSRGGGRSRDIDVLVLGEPDRDRVHGAVSAAEQRLADAITSITDTARELDQHDAEVIAGILRCGSDRNRARYVLKLIDAVELPTRRRGRGSPDPDRSPSSPASSRATKPARRIRER